MFAQNIIRLECINRAYIPNPYIIIWVGTHKYQLSNGKYMTHFLLSRPEIEWLAEELSDWLVPVVRD